VETADAVLVGWPDELHQVKDVLAQLNATPLPECGRPPKSYRPWGTNDGFDAGECFLVKHEVVNFRASFSLQMQHRRAEHWIVVGGTLCMWPAPMKRSCARQIGLRIPSVYLDWRAPSASEILQSNAGSDWCAVGAYLGDNDIVSFEENLWACSPKMSWQSLRHPRKTAPCLLAR